MAFLSGLAGLGQDNMDERMMWSKRRVGLGSDRSWWMTDVLKVSCSIPAMC